MPPKRKASRDCELKNRSLAKRMKIEEEEDKEYNNPSPEGDQLWETLYASWLLLLSVIPKTSKILEPFYSESGKSYKMMTKMGYQVEYEYGKDCLEMIRDRNYDVVVTNPIYTWSKLRIVLALLKQLNKPFAMVIPLVATARPEFLELFSGSDLKIVKTFEPTYFRVDNIVADPYKRLQCVYVFWKIEGAHSLPDVMHLDYSKDRHWKRADILPNDEYISHNIEIPETLGKVINSEKSKKKPSDEDYSDDEKFVEESDDEEESNEDSDIEFQQSDEESDNKLYRYRSIYVY